MRQGGTKPQAVMQMEHTSPGGRPFWGGRRSVIPTCTEAPEHPGHIHPPHAGGESQLDRSVQLSEFLPIVGGALLSTNTARSHGVPRRLRRGGDASIEFGICAIRRHVVVCGTCGSCPAASGRSAACAPIRSDMRCGWRGRGLKSAATSDCGRRSRIEKRPAMANHRSRASGDQLKRQARPLIYPWAAPS